MNDAITLAIKRAAQSDMGIYPRSSPKGDRTEWQDGWNAYGMQLLYKESAVAMWLEKHEHRDKIIELLTSQHIFLHEREGSVKMFFSTSDLFAWGYADSEEIVDNEMLVTIQQVIEDDPAWGTAKWMCKRVGMKPQGPVEDAMKEAGSWDDEMESLKDNPAF